MNTKALVTMTASIIAANAVLAADWTVEEDTRLSADMTVDTLTVNAGVTLDLNGYKLTCSALAGEGTITRTGENDDLTSPEAAGATPSAVTWNYAGTIASGSVTNLFDNDFTTYSDPHRLRTNTALDNQPFTICYDFGKDTVVNKYKIYNGWGYLRRSPYIWDFEGSNDNSSWTTLHSVEGSEVADIWSKLKETKEFSFDNTDAYRYYKIVFKKTGGTDFEIKQLEYFNTNPGELHVNVADGEMENSTVAISGNVKVVKEGLGTFIPSKKGQTYTGGTEIVAGTVKAVTIGTYDGGCAFGPTGSTITVSTSATSVGAFDVNGQTRYGGYNFVLNGGTVKNTSVLNNTSGKLIDVSLLADSMFDFAQGTCGFYDPNSTGETKLDLAGHTLTLSGAGGTQVEHLTVTSQGKILVADGFVKFYSRSGHCPTNDLRIAVLETGTNGQVIVQNAGNGIEVKLGDYICNTAATDTGHYGSGYRYTPRVYGTFKPNTDYFHGVELQDGATLDLSGRSGAFNLRGGQYPGVSASYTSLHTVTFADNATINIKIANGTSGKIVTWTTAPSNLDTLTFVCTDESGKTRNIVKSETGLGVPSGLIFSVY